jgi:hypothetical protein
VRGARREAQLEHDPDVACVVETCLIVGVIVVDDCHWEETVAMLVPVVGGCGRGRDMRQ